MIWVFDSGMWGRITLEYLQAELPQQSFLYLWDTLYLPYGEKSAEFLRDRTFACLEWMFQQWCALVILACNTASAYAIREWQDLYPDRKVLSVTIPGVEVVAEWNYHHPLLLATQATVSSSIYTKVSGRLLPDYDISWISASPSGRVEAVESGVGMQDAVDSFFEDFDLSDMDCIVLWCTHYPLLTEYIYTAIWIDIPILNPWLYAAQQLVSYIYRHPEIASQLQKNTVPEVQYRVTGEGSTEMRRVVI